MTRSDEVGNHCCAHAAESDESNLHWLISFYLLTIGLSGDN
jgi:hypothetical protein